VTANPSWWSTLTKAPRYTPYSYTVNAQFSGTSGSSKRNELRKR